MTGNTGGLWKVDILLVVVSFDLFRLVRMPVSAMSSEIHQEIPHSMD